MKPITLATILGALVGGPNSGKIKSPEFLAKNLSKMGYRVFLVPEGPTKILHPGLKDIEKISKRNYEKYLRIQKLILKDHIQQKKLFLELAQLFPDEQTIILFDRAGMDPKAYVRDEKDFDRHLKELQLTYADVCESMDIVIHLVTTAWGKEDVHTRTMSKNKARRETTLHAARKADKKTLMAWLGHPRLKIIDNRTNFAGKQERILNALISGKEIERKFLLKRPPNFNCLELQQSEMAAIQQFYAIIDGKKVRFRKRTRRGCSIYYQTKKKMLSGITREEKEVRITEEDYENDPVQLPPFLEIKREVTNEPIFRNSNIATSKTLF